MRRPLPRWPAWAPARSARSDGSSVGQAAEVGDEAPGVFDYEDEEGCDGAEGEEVFGPTAGMGGDFVEVMLVGQFGGYRGAEFRAEGVVDFHGELTTPPACGAQGVSALANEP